MNERLAFLILKYLIAKMKHKKGKILNNSIVNTEYLNDFSFETKYCGAY